MVWDVPLFDGQVVMRPVAYTLTFRGAERLARRLEALHRACQPGCSSLWEYQPGPYRWPLYTTDNAGSPPTEGDL